MCLPHCTFKNDSICVSESMRCGVHCIPDGVLDDYEGCDDANTVDGDGCSCCLVEPGFTCSSSIGFSSICFNAYPASLIFVVICELETKLQNSFFCKAVAMFFPCD